MAVWNGRRGRGLPGGMAVCAYYFQLSCPKLYIEQSRPGPAKLGPFF